MSANNRIRRFPTYGQTERAFAPGKSARKKRLSPFFWSLVLVFVPAVVARADVFQDYENFAEGFLGQTVVDDGVTYHDANRVSGFFPDGQPFDPDELGSEYIIEQARLFYLDFPDYGSPNNSMTFGQAFIPGDNLTIGPLASIWLDLDVVGNAVSFDLAYLENGPWGGIEYVLEAFRNGTSVGSNSFVIDNQGGRDNGAFRTMSITGVEFDQLHLYGWLNNEYTAPRGMIDDLSIVTVPEPSAWVLISIGGLCLHRRSNARRPTRVPTTHLT